MTQQLDEMIAATEKQRARNEIRIAKIQSRTELKKARMEARTARFPDGALPVLLGVLGLMFVIVTISFFIWQGVKGVSEGHQVEMRQYDTCVKQGRVFIPDLGGSGVSLCLPPGETQAPATHG